MSVTPRESSGSTLQRIDDTSSKLEYSSGWNANAIPNDQATIHTSTTPGSTVTFTFNGMYTVIVHANGEMLRRSRSTGTFVAVYGAIVNEPVTATFTLDDTAPVSQAQTQPPDTPQYNWVFFSTTPPLDPGVHSLTVEVTAGTFNLDYIEFTSIGGSDDGAQDGSPASLGTSVSSSPSAVMSTASASSSALPFSNARLSNGVIAGLVVVGVLILCALLGTVLFFHHRRGRRVQHLRQSPEKSLDMILAGAFQRLLIPLCGLIR